MNIVFSTDDAGAEMCLTSLFSIIANNRDASLNVYVLESGLSHVNKDYFLRLASRFPTVHIDFVKIDGKVLSDIAVPRREISVQAYFRYLTPNLLREVDRALYLDIDTLCVKPIAGLYSTNIDGYHVAAVRDFQVTRRYEVFDRIVGLNRTRYFNTGVLLMNLAQMREDDMTARFFFNATENRRALISKGLDVFVDQTIANLTFRSVLLDRRNNVLLETLVSDLRRVDPVIVHYSGLYKPFRRLDGDDARVKRYQDLYAEYYRQLVELIDVRPQRLAAEALISVITQYRRLYEARCEKIAAQKEILESREHVIESQQKTIDDQAVHSRAQVEVNEAQAKVIEDLRRENAALRSIRGSARALGAGLRRRLSARGR